MICLGCNTNYSRKTKGRCPRCDTALVPDDLQNRDALVASAVRARIVVLVNEWESAGIVDARAAAEMLESVQPTPARQPAPDVSAGSAAREPEKQPEPAVVAAVAVVAIADMIASRPQSLPRPAEQAPEPVVRTPHLADVDTEGALEAGQALLHGSHQSDGSFGRGLEALVALDAPARVLHGHDHTAPSRWETEVRPLLYENVGWFIGTLLVLAGSVYGVREAWQTLGGVPRHLVVAGALFVYHASFVGMAALIARRSASAGRVLGAIATGLLPVVFVSLAALFGVARVIGTVAGAGFAALSWLTLRSVGKRFELSEPSAVAMVLVPILCAELPLAWLPAAAIARLVLPFVGVALLAYAADRSVTAGPEARPSGALIAAGLYAALALGVFAIVGAPDMGESEGGWLPPGSHALAGFTLWSAALAGVVAELSRGEKIASVFPRAAPVWAVSALSIVAAAVLGALLAMSGARVPPDRAVLLVSTITAALGTLIFARVAVRQSVALHLAVPCALATSILAAQFVLPRRADWAAFGGASAAGALLLAARGLDRGPRRTGLLAWGTVTGALAMLVSTSASATDAMHPLAATAASAAVLALCAHVAAGFRMRPLHYFGGVCVAIATAAWWVPGASGDPVTLGAVILGAIFAAAALGYESAAAARGMEMRAATTRPFDDLSLVACMVAVANGLYTLRTPTMFVGFEGAIAMTIDAIRAAAPVIVAGLGLLVRSFRDRSRLVSFAGAATLAGVATVVAGAQTSSQSALLGAAITLACTLVASLRMYSAELHAQFTSADGPMPGASTRPVGTRSFLGGIPLPFAARGRALLTDGFAMVALASAGITVVSVINWIGTRVEPERSWVVLSAVLLTIAGLVGFATHAFGAIRARGSVLALAATGACIALAALANRVGRPLPPQVVGLRLTIIAVLLWALALVVRRYGPGIGARLGRPVDGGLYHLVPHAGVAALGIVLAADVLMVAAGDVSHGLVVVPPMMLIGAAVVAALLARSSQSVWITHIALALAIPSAAIVSVQRSVLGPALVPLDLPGARWVREGTEAASRVGFWLDPTAYLPANETLPGLWGRAGHGVASIGVGIAVLALLLGRGGARVTGAISWLSLGRDGEPATTRLHGAFTTWASVAAGLVLAAAWTRADLIDAALIFAAGAVLIGSRRDVHGLTISAGGALGLIHAAAQSGERLPWWAGPAFAAAGVAVVIAVPQIAARTQRRTEVMQRPVHLLAVIAWACGWLYALAAGGRADSLAAGPRVLMAASDNAGGRWLENGSIALTIGLAAIGFALIATQSQIANHRLAARVAAALSHLLAAFALAAGFTAAFVAITMSPAVWRGILDVEPGAPSLFLFVVVGLGMPVASCSAAMAAVAHASGRRSDAHGHDEVSFGERWARDVLLVAVGVLSSAFAAVATAPAVGGGPWYALPAGAIALGIAIVVSVHAAWREGTARHVYFVQVAAVAGYALVRAVFARALRPEFDAMFALILGFVLVGVTVQARRAGIPPVAAATRRFAALLPLAIALLMPREANLSAALIAAGAGALYGALAWVERSRFLGSLGAAACNVALLLAALAAGLDGTEIYLAPLGLLVLALGQIFAAPMLPASRLAVRVIGALLVYAPAAVQLTFQVGAAQNGLYPVLFGVACLAGVAIGMLLHIRAYLALGTGFLVLDVVASLVQAGLRDHRIGFLVLSLSGIAILGTMVLTTLRREEFRRFVALARARWGRWE